MRLMFSFKSARRQRIAERLREARRSIKSLKVRRFESNTECVARRDRS
jgi:hypothetical protein